jgi:hypothetical protein
MHFPKHDAAWCEALDAIIERFGRRDVVVTPNEFLEALDFAVPYVASHHWPLHKLNHILLHKGMLAFFKPGFLHTLMQGAVPVFANEVFVLLTRTLPVPQFLNEQSCHLRPIAGLLQPNAPVACAYDPSAGQPREKTTRIVVSTYNRPETLAVCLRSVAVLNVPVLVVDDGSNAEHHQANEDACLANGAVYLRLPMNRGVSAALSVGLEFWLADPDVQWVSSFNDDVEVTPILFDVLERVQDAELRPVLTGRQDQLHPVLAIQQLETERVLECRACSGQHIHAHRSYWREVLPIPTNWLGAPRQTEETWVKGIGADEDFWVTAWAPTAVSRRGRPVICVPRLVRHLAHSSDESTWDNPRLDEMASEPPLRLTLEPE